jgi:hypothetical protein
LLAVTAFLPFNLLWHHEGSGFNCHGGVLSQVTRPSPTIGTMPDSPDVLIAFANQESAEFQQAAHKLQLPNLANLCHRLVAQAADTGAGNSLSPPHERALAQAARVAGADGQIPWAAWTLAQRVPPLEKTTADAWAFITPCHWHAAIDHVTLSDPQLLDLPEAESRALLAAMQPYFATDGITLVFDQATRWLAHGEVFRSLATASIDRVVGRNLGPWMPTAPSLRRLQNEMQMLLYTHPLNEARMARGAQPVNSFWVSGAGAFAGALPGTGLGGLPTVNTSLRGPALQGNWPAWVAAWQALDADLGARLLAAHKAGQRVTLTLCGERAALRLTTAPRSLTARFISLLSHQPIQNLLKQL